MPSGRALRALPALHAGGVALVVASWLSVAGAAQSPGRPGDDLPDGPGRKILLAACTTCHDLDEVTKFKGYYTRAQWKDIVVTMQEYGAAVTKDDVEVLADYLAANLGKTD